MSAIILFSGGVDSTAATGVAVKNGHSKISLLSLDYGSLHGVAERTAALNVYGALKARFLDIAWTFSTLLLPDVFSGGKSALMGDVPIPDAEYQNLDVEGPSSTVVPFRNANLISVATSLAERDAFRFVYIAVHASDYNRWAYPDCSPEFIGAMTDAVYIGTMHKVRLIAPFQWMTKAEVIAFGNSMDLPLSLTWSCYRGGIKHCGSCPTCIERHKAFIQGIGSDPTEYLNDPYRNRKNG